MKQNKLPYKVRLRINKSKANVFVLKDFLDLSSYDQILRALRRMIKEGLLIKIGQGIYAKTDDPKNRQPITFINILAQEALKKFGVKIANSSYMNAYNAGVSTQVPNGRVIAVNRRIRRKIGIDGDTIKFEFMGKDYRKQWYNSLKRAFA